MLNKIKLIHAYGCLLSKKWVELLLVVPKMVSALKFYNFANLHISSQMLTGLAYLGVVWAGFSVFAEMVQKNPEVMGQLNFSPRLKGVLSGLDFRLKPCEDSLGFLQREKGSDDPIKQDAISAFRIDVTNIGYAEFIIGSIRVSFEKDDLPWTISCKRSMENPRSLRPNESCSIEMIFDFDARAALSYNEFMGQIRRLAINKKLKTEVLADVERLNGQHCERRFELTDVHLGLLISQYLAPESPLNSMSPSISS